MTALVAHFDDGRSISVRLGDRLGGGAVGDIHRLEGMPGVVAKVYRLPADRTAYEQKIEDMIRDPPNLPPLQENGREYPQIAWPIAALRESTGWFVGFVMSEIDMVAATELENVLQKVSRRVRKLPEFYGGRVLLAANLSAVMAELHDHQHYFIDMKPVNIRFYPGSWYLAILDTDGFSVHGETRWPARQFSEEYIAPEAKGEGPAVLGLEQDLFALAVIIFRLLNNGLHPYQGLDLRPNLPTTIQERIFENLYAYGRTSSAEVRPAPSTIHDTFEDATRELFDRAFGGDPATRPTAEDWKVHLQGLVTAGVLRRCRRRPDEHMHFSRTCGLCALDARRAAALRPRWTSKLRLVGAAVAASSGRAQTPPRPRSHAPKLRVVVPVPLPPPALPPLMDARLKWFVLGFVVLTILGAVLAERWDRTPSVAASYQAPQAAPEQEAAARGRSSPDRGRQPDSPASSATAKMYELDQVPLAIICAGALSPSVTGRASAAQARWDDRAESANYVLQARRRGHNPQSCAEELWPNLSAPPSPSFRTATTAVTGWRTFADDSSPPKRLQLNGLRFGPSGRLADGQIGVLRAVSTIDPLTTDMVATVEVENAIASQTSVTFEIRQESRVASACPPVILSAGSCRASCNFRRLSLAAGAYQVIAGSDGNDLISSPLLVVQR
ncbi:hypothetical protein BH10PSE6_BH10PSE6_04970 [soil metagenome]